MSALNDDERSELADLYANMSDREAGMAVWVAIAGSVGRGSTLPPASKAAERVTQLIRKALGRNGQTATT